MPLYQWSTTPANNASAGSIDWAEGQPPSTVNDSARQMMADVATWFAAPEWLNYGLTPTYVSSTQFTVSGNQTVKYAAGRRVKASVTAGTVYGTITASSFGSSITTVTVSMDSGSLDSGLSEVDVGLVTPGKSLLSSLLNVQVLTSTTTYNATPGTRLIIVEGVGPGGAGGGAVATDSSHVSGGSGGASGSYAKAMYTSGFTGGIAVTMGAPGVGVAGATGGNGGTTTFGSLLTLPGGIGGVAGSPLVVSGVSLTSPSTGGGTPSGSGILVASNGNPGQPAILLSSNIFGGCGGGSFYGGGAPGVGSGTPWAGQAPGAGGGGAANPINSGAVAGGNGANSMVAVYEFA